MKVMRIVLLITNGVWLPDFAYQSASHVYYLATYPATHDLIFATSFLAVTIPAVEGSLTLAGNIAYMGLFPPHAQNEIGTSASQIMRAMRIVLLIGNGFWLTIYAVGAPFSVYVLANHDDYPVAEAIATHVVCLFILAGNFVYIWRSRRHAHNEKGTNASHAPQPLGGSAAQLQPPGDA